MRSALLAGSPVQVIQMRSKVRGMQASRSRTPQHITQHSACFAVQPLQPCPLHSSCIVTRGKELPLSMSMLLCGDEVQYVWFKPATRRTVCCVGSSTGATRSSLLGSAGSRMVIRNQPWLLPLPLLLPGWCEMLQQQTTTPTAHEARSFRLRVLQIGGKTGTTCGRCNCVIGGCSWS
jgi:hypothetical protein